MQDIKLVNKIPISKKMIFFPLSLVFFSYFFYLGQIDNGFVRFWLDQSVGILEQRGFRRKIRGIQSQGKIHIISKYFWRSYDDLVFGHFSQSRG